MCEREVVDEIGVVDGGQILGSIECREWGMILRDDIVVFGFRGENRIKGDKNESREIYQVVVKIIFVRDDGGLIQGC